MVYHERFYETLEWCTMSEQSESNGAGEETLTLDLFLGKEAL